MRLFKSFVCLAASMVFLAFPGQVLAGSRVVRDWLTVYDNPDTHGTDDLWGMVADGNGNVFITGNTNTGEDGDQIYHYLTAKYNTRGEEQWVKTYHRGDEYCNHSAHDIVIDDEGNSYVTGVSVDWTEGNGQTQADYATIKYSTSGVELWSAVYGNENEDPDSIDDWGFSLAVDSSQNVYVTGITEIDGTADRTVGFATIKYNPNGAQAWAARYEEVVVGNWSNNSFIPKIALDQAGNVYVAGTKSDRSGDPHTSDFILLKYNNLGVFQWVTVYNSAENYSEELTDLVVDAEGNAYLTGLATNPDVSTDDDFITVKINTDGTILWDDRWDLNGGRDSARAIALDSQGNVLVTGRAYMDGLRTVTIKYDPDGNRIWLRQYAGVEKVGGNDIVLDWEDNIYVAGEKYLNYYRCTILKYNRNGKLIWRETIADNNNYGAQKIALDDDRNVYLAGVNWYTGASNDIFIMKYLQTGADAGQIPQTFLLLGNTPN